MFTPDRTLVQLYNCNSPPRPKENALNQIASPWLGWRRRTAAELTCSRKREFWFKNSRVGGKQAYTPPPEKCCAFFDLPARWRWSHLSNLAAAV